MKILVLSDISSWVGLEKLLDKNKPDLVVLAGDLVLDGWTPHSHEHTENFYRFLEYAGKTSVVLVIEGNHDEECKGDYDSLRINQTLGCQEISGRVVDAKGYRVLGLSHSDTWYLRRLKAIIERYKGIVDVVVMHGSRLLLVSTLQPKIIIRGGYALGRYLVNRIPSVFNNCSVYTTVELRDKKVFSITQYNMRTGAQARPRLETLLPRKFKWLKPYPR